MLITLTRDINPRKRWVRGAVMNWPRPVITKLEQELGDSNWYQTSTHLEPTGEHPATSAKRPYSRRKSAETVEA